jgi:hypothetical protein
MDEHNLKPWVSELIGRALRQHSDLLRVRPLATFNEDDRADLINDICYIEAVAKGFCEDDPTNPNKPTVPSPSPHTDTASPE